MRIELKTIEPSVASYEMKSTHWPLKFRYGIENSFCIGNRTHIYRQIKENMFRMKRGKQKKTHTYLKILKINGQRIEKGKRSESKCASVEIGRFWIGEFSKGYYEIISSIQSVFFPFCVEMELEATQFHSHISNAHSVIDLCWDFPLYEWLVCDGTLSCIAKANAVKKKKHISHSLIM